MTPLVVWLAGILPTAALAYQVGLWLDRTRTRGSVPIALWLGALWPLTLPLLLWASIEYLLA